MDKELTRRQRQIMEMVCGGMKSAEIGKQLGISHRTVEIHRQIAFKRLGARTACHAAVLFDRASGRG